MRANCFEALDRACVPNVCLKTISAPVFILRPRPDSMEDVCITTEKLKISTEKQCVSTKKGGPYGPPYC